MIITHQRCVERGEELEEPLVGLVVALVGVAEPLEGADADGAVEAARPEGDAVPHVAVQQVTLHLAVPGHVKHVPRYVQPDPVFRAKFWNNSQ